MLNKVARFIENKKLLDAAQTHIVALSGGADSVALLRVLKQLGYTLEAAHCNFRLRGAESDRDELFVKQLCERESIPLHLIHFDTKTYAELHQVSIEMAARELRYRYFEQLRQSIGAAEVCVAHHQDDAVETLLMNLIRGTGVHGLTGIRPRNGHVVRPLLCASRAEILRFLDAIGQDYVVDSTNLTPDVVRNKLRLEVLPLLQQINPAVAANIAKTAQRMAEAEQVFNAAMATTIEELFVDGVININSLLLQPSPEYLLHEILSPRGFTPSQVEQVFAALNAPSGRVFSSSTHEVAVDRGRLVVEQRQAQLPTRNIPEEGTYIYHGHMKFCFTVSDTVKISKSPDCATLDADKVQFPLVVRPVIAGDRFQPFGMVGTRLISDYLTDRKYTVFEKRRQLVIEDAAQRVVWLVGERTDQRFAVTEGTKRVLFIKNTGQDACQAQCSEKDSLIF